MDKSIERIIRRVLGDVRAKGRDRLTQTELAVKAFYRHGSIAKGTAAGEWVRL